MTGRTGSSGKFRRFIYEPAKSGRKCHIHFGAERLGAGESAVKRLLTLDYQTPIDQALTALEAVGRRLVVEDRVMQGERRAGPAFDRARPMQ